MIIVILVIAAVAAMVLQARSSTRSDAGRVTRGVAESFAHAPGTVEAMQSPDRSALLQPHTAEVQRATDVDSVVVVSTSLVQITATDPSHIGQPYQPPQLVQEQVLPRLENGETVTFNLSQPGFRSISTAVPVFDADHRLLGFVAASIAVERVDAIVNAHLPVLLGGAAGAVVLAAAGAAVASRRVLRQTHGLGPAELARMYEHHDAVLHAVREGVLIIDGDGRLMLANDEAKRLLALPAGPEQQPVAALGLPPATAALLTSAEEVTDGIHRTGDRLLAVNKRPTAPYGGLSGSVVTLRDTTELHDLTSRIADAGQRRRLLYEAGMRIGQSLDITRTCEDLAAVAVEGFADRVFVDLVDSVSRGEEPPAGIDGPGEVLRRTVLVGPSPGAMPVGAAVVVLADGPQARAVADGRAVVDAHHAALTVPLRIRGGLLGLVEFGRTAPSPPFDREDVLLAEDLAARAAVSIDNARRYTREHGTAMALQRSLLPRIVPERTGLDIAHSYLPATAGVGGDWYDVIPLPGFRTALLVGDVVGHGINAAVVMGRLRTALRTFATLDLPPDEVLGRLDELVSQLDEDASELNVTGSTCVYAVYDPVTGHCLLSRAGHLGPAVLAPDGTVSYPEIASAPPLGVGGYPFGTTEIALAPGSHLLLFSDGLVETRGRDIDEGLEQLRSALAGRTGTGPDDVCALAVESCLTPHPADDVALLVARTGLLPADRTASWDVPADPAAVAPVRAACVRQLTEWGLEEISFSTELILSELITNAIRHGAPPVRVRMLLDTSLVCEVFDASSTAPHLRWAATTDEGGRGIFLVAQLAHRWGTRYTPTGKVIWSEQSLTADPAAFAPLDDL
ncbi:SpoIIE family protein phosphatase/ATP-binding protein [Streptomyces sp. TLI_171]|uniref:SpoIIE family protein phosphatase/ATP-binding protein n=1 Tax=Streptomyces sp. TLI_171 TaxID=1938859 RepID=UPI000C1A6EDF|nr:SpoIIE family protein phosphatase/ATP-binding protein [Streptomyces sp. TLI_171]RKE22189.1 integral membrane sensor protein [Streptomyces sp. TLI_171]